MLEIFGFPIFLQLEKYDTYFFIMNVMFAKYFMDVRINALQSKAIIY